MIVVATFRCDNEKCSAKVDTVVVRVDPSDLQEVLEKLSAHSCYYQSDAWPYTDLMILDGRLVRCELMPESPGLGHQLRVLTVEEFRDLWQYSDELHHEAEAEDERPQRNADKGDRDWEGDLTALFVVATLFDGERSERKADTVVVSVEPSELDEAIRRLSLHSCYTQTYPCGYVDLIIVEGILIRCEFAPGVVKRRQELKVLTMDEFRDLWCQQAEWHRTVEIDFKKRLYSRRATAFGESEMR